MILTITDWPTNAELIADCARLGYLRKEWFTLDPTYGFGTFWKRWRPDNLVATDLDPTRTQVESVIDFRHLPWPDQHFDACVYDPPYKLNGKPDPDIDGRYGVDVPARWQDRMALIMAGAAECARVTRHNLLVKCQDQVVSGKKRFQTDEITKVVTALGFGKVDRLDNLGYRPQDPKRGQKHAHSASSQMLVFKRGW